MLSALSKRSFRHRWLIAQLILIALLGAHHRPAFGARGPSPRVEFRENPSERRMEERHSLRDGDDADSDDDDEEPHANHDHGRIDRREHLKDHVLDVTDFDGEGLSHLREHLSEIINVPKDFEDSDDKHLIFYFFYLHDFDHNGKLDGIELMSLLSDYHHSTQSGEAKGGNPRDEAESERQHIIGADSESDHRPMKISGFAPPRPHSQAGDAVLEDDNRMHDHSSSSRTGVLLADEVEPIVDSILDDYDFNGDGYVTFTEFTTEGRNSEGMFV